MSFLDIISQNLISKSVISNIDSLTDITNLITCHPLIFDDLHDAKIRKTIHVENDTLFIKYVSEGNILFDSIDELNLSYKGVTIPIDKTCKYLIKSKDILEHISTISICLNELYYNVNVSSINSLSTIIASFIDKVFNICPNADTLQIYSGFDIHFFITKYLTSSKIKVLKNFQFRHLMSYINHCEDKPVVSKLTNLEVLDLSFGKINLYDKPRFLEAFENMIQQLPQKNKVKIIISGYVFREHLFSFEKFLKITQKYDINICLSDLILSHRSFFDMCIIMRRELKNFPIHNIVELDVNFCNMESFDTFLKALSFFKKLKTLKLDFESEMFEFEINEKTMEIFDKHFNSKIMSNLNGIEELYLRFEEKQNNCNCPSFIIEDEATKRIFENLGETIRVLHLKNIPNLTSEMSKILFRNCPNIVDISLVPMHSIDANFVENMKKLKFVYLKGNHRLNIPRNLEMIFVYLPEKENTEHLSKMNTEEFHFYFQQQFKRNFRISIRNCCNDHPKHAILFNNILTWNVYLKKMNLYKNPF